MQPDTVKLSRRISRLAMRSLRSFCSARSSTRRNARASFSSVSPVISMFGGGSGYSSGSLVSSARASSSSAFMRAEASLKCLYSVSWRISSSSGESAPSSSGLGGRGSMARDLISSSVAAICKNSLAESMSSSSTRRMDSRYCSVISLTKMSWMSIFALVMSVKSRSSGPSNCFSDTTYMRAPHQGISRNSSCASQPTPLSAPLTAKPRILPNTLENSSTISTMEAVREARAEAKRSRLSTRSLST